MARNRVKSKSCPNCEFLFQESFNYCPNCGQENHTHKLPLKHFMVELMEAIFHFDTKIISTLKELLVNPGLMTFNYNQNKRSRYVPPIRLYIFISFVFFLLLASTSNHALNKGLEKKHKSSINLNFSFQGTTRDTAGNYQLKVLKEASEPTNELIDNYLLARKVNLHWYNKNLYRGLVKYTSGHETMAEIMHKFYKNLSTAMFILMPIFALYLLVFYRKRKKFYAEHLIFSIHFHSLAFLLLCFSLIFSAMQIAIDWVFFLMIFIYLILYLRKVYQQGWAKSILKTILLTLIYSLTLAIGMMFIFIVSFA